MTFLSKWSPCVWEINSRSTHPPRFAKEGYTYDPGQIKSDCCSAGFRDDAHVVDVPESQFAWWDTGLVYFFDGSVYSDFEEHVDFLVILRGCEIFEVGCDEFVEVMEDSESCF